jgi:putative YhgA-like transposase
MALRLLSYVSLLLEELVRKRETAPKRWLPPVVPIVLYRGTRTVASATKAAGAVRGTTRNRG